MTLPRVKSTGTAGTTRALSGGAVLVVAGVCARPGCDTREHRAGSGVCHWHGLSAVQRDALSGAIG
ncbi:MULTISPECIES: hypothetical protein [Protofrankia]|uniref:Uncharacterized protein n=1 Tax=Protofrankia coriariae TaxID=1562887 RepID=A0ABR5F1Y6_9ACTN|nr:MULTISPECIES: hypothetical protein [Protofrankia]KLL10741.1 hypothetical protein FrCorBMG51_15710 [Protofrankia coriariae]ONH31568.1 hypothetical protein BL254_22935 [Protofrankia sp. BMG5.30]